MARPDGGAARVLGFDVMSERNAIRARVAVTGQFASLDDDLTGYENLIVFRRLRFPGGSRELKGPQRELKGAVRRFSHGDPGVAGELGAAA